jgi:hypothetical protein
MDFETAVELSKQIEEKAPGLVVMGFRRMRADALDSWALDIMNKDTQKVATIDEKDLWERRIAEIAE